MDEAIVYLNGQYLPRSQARLDLEDRGGLFADGVYEVVRFYDGQPLGMAEHLQRLHRSLAGIELQVDPALIRLDVVSDELLRRNGLREAKVYWEVTRGSAPRRHEFPTGVTPTVFAIAYADMPVDFAAALPTATAVTLPDERWPNCWIKSLMLLPNVLAKNKAHRAGAEEAILVRDGRVTEGTATSVLVVRRGEVWTHPADRWILPGVTRDLVLRLSRGAGIPVREEAFGVDELMTADEAAILGTTTHVTALRAINNRATPSQRPVLTRLHELFLTHLSRR